MGCKALFLVVSAHAFTPGSREHALARWVESEGGFVGDVACGEREGVRGLYATKDVPKVPVHVCTDSGCLRAAHECAVPTACGAALGSEYDL